MIEAKGIYKSFGNVDVIKGIDIHIDKGEIVTIVGASGAGKSTLPNDLYIPFASIIRRRLFCSFAV